jgi:hypothetical protein
MFDRFPQSAARLAVAAIIASFVAPFTMAGVIFEESFENPVKTTEGQDPTGWAGEGHPSYFQLTVEGGGWTTPYGTQGISTYSTGVASPSTYLALIEAGTAYKLSFNVSSTAAKGEYRAEIWSVTELLGGGTSGQMVAYVSGDTNGSKDMSYKDSVTWIGTPALAGSWLTIKLMQDPDRTAWQHTPYWDNVKVETVVPNTYDLWSGGNAFANDANGDGIPNGLAWMMGAASPHADATGMRPELDRASDDEFIFLTYRMTEEAAASGAKDVFRYSTDLSTWTTAVDSYETEPWIYEDEYGPGIHMVEWLIDREAIAPDGRFFYAVGTTPP